MNKAITTQEPTISLSLSVAAALIDMASQHVQDVVSGIQDGTYSADDNKDFASKEAAVDIARKAYEMITMPERSITALMIRVGDRIVQRPSYPDGREVVDVSHGPRDHQVRVTFEGDDEARSFYGAADHVVVRRSETGAEDRAEASADQGRFNSLLDDVIGSLSSFHSHLYPRKAALKIAVRDEYRDTGNSQADYEHLRDAVERAINQMRDYAVLGLDGQGLVIQWSKTDQNTYYSGDDLAEFGLHNLHEDELELVFVSVDAWRAAKQAAALDAAQPDSAGQS